MRAIIPHGPRPHAYSLAFALGVQAWCRANPLVWDAPTLHPRCVHLWLHGFMGPYAWAAARFLPPHLQPACFRWLRTRLYLPSRSHMTPERTLAAINQMLRQS